MGGGGVDAPAHSSITIIKFDSFVSPIVMRLIQCDEADKIREQKTIGIQLEKKTISTFSRSNFRVRVSV